MEFVTIHDLSRELNAPARVIRYRLIHLIADGKLKEHEDFRREDFKDDQHFLWKINPLSFLRQTGLKPVTAVNQIDDPLVTTGNKADNQPENSNGSPVKSSSTVVNQSDNHLLPLVNEVGKTANNSVTKTGEPSLEREMIDLLKDQIQVKDGQLREQGEQLKDLNDLNVKLTGTMLQQNQKIENLLRLTGGKSETSSREASADTPPPASGDLAQAA
jgi:hypothetical protein